MIEERTKKLRIRPEAAAMLLDVLEALERGPVFDGPFTPKTGEDAIKKFELWLRHPARDLREALRYIAGEEWGRRQATDQDLAKKRERLKNWLEPELPYERHADLPVK